ncbi:MAG: T9SS type A sorting domain-containing protein [Bacteroidales bacterium]|nr:T9SS type A sorting domain-containing protein [Bacteroidales bacterium]
MRYGLLFLLLSCALGVSTALAQEIVSSGGAYHQNADASLSWTVGEPLTETLATGSITLTQGFHQGRILATSIGDFAADALKMQVYPNPAVYSLFLKVEGADFSVLQYKLFDIEGKILLTENIRSDMTEIDLESYPAGSYILRITTNKGIIVRAFLVTKR